MKTLTQTAAIFLSTLVLTGGTGCMSCMARKEGSHPGLYPGIRAGTETQRNPHAGIAGVLVRLDRPFSFTLDTVLLPVDVLGVIFGSKKEKAAEPENSNPLTPVPQP